MKKSDFKVLLNGQHVNPGIGLYDPEFAGPDALEPRYTERWVTDSVKRSGEVRVEQIPPTRKSKRFRELQATLPTPEEIRMRAYTRGW